MEYILMSVVIPVYNVQEYLQKCVDSVLNQTISNYEVILVDDGSRDGCPGICDKYAEVYENVISLHKENGGLSDARNFGVKHASADYIVFVDSDDYVDPEYLESLWNLHLKYSSDIVVQGVKREQENGELLNEIKSTSEMLVGPQKAIELMCYGKNVAVFAYAKLYLKSYLLKASYPVGKLHEDVFTTYRLFDQCEKIVIGTESHYHYLVRKGSILNSKFSVRYLDSLEGAHEIIDFVKCQYPKIKDAAYVRLAIESNALLHRALKSEQYFMVEKKVMLGLSGKWRAVLKSKELPEIIKLQLVFCRLLPNIYKKIYVVVKR